MPLYAQFLYILSDIMLKCGINSLNDVDYDLMKVFEGFIVAVREVI